MRFGEGRKRAEITAFGGDFSYLQTISRGIGEGFAGSRGR
jgi:hypothetical protein